MEICSTFSGIQTAGHCFVKYIFITQDAQEFLCYLFDRLNTEHSNTFSEGNGERPPSVISLFEEQPYPRSCTLSYLFTTQRLSAQNVSFLLKSKRHSWICPLISQLRKGRKKAATYHSYTALRAFLRQKNLEINGCAIAVRLKERRPSSSAYKTFLWLHISNGITSPQQVLCVVLKRFEWTATSRKKVQTAISFPFVLYMSKIKTPTTLAPVYDLSCVVVHHGPRLAQGHYTAYCKHEGISFYFFISHIRLVASLQ